LPIRNSAINRTRLIVTQIDPTIKNSELVPGGTAMKRSLESPTPAPPVALLTMGQVTQRMSVSKRTVLRWIETGLLPAVRVGSVIRIKPHDLEQLIAQHQIQVTESSVSAVAPHPNDRQLSATRGELT
jgi:excisionase family DNA binding protein